MTITQIRYFVDVAKYKSITKAASKNFVVQQVVSKQVKRLEEELGFALLDHTKREVTLTETGQKFADFWGEMLTRQQELILNARLKNTGQTQLIRIGTPPISRVYDFISESIASVCRNGKQVEFEVETDSFRELNQKLAEGKLDLIISLSDENMELSGNYQTYRLVETEPSVILSENHPLYHDGCLITTWDLEGQTLYYPSNTFSKYAEYNIKRQLEELQIHPEKMIPVNDLTSLEMTLYSGQGMALIYREFFRNPYGKLHSFPSVHDNKAGKNSISLTFRKTDNTFILEFAAKIKELFQSF